MALPPLVSRSSGGCKSPPRGVLARRHSAAMTAHCVLASLEFLARASTSLAEGALMEAAQVAGAETARQATAPPKKRVTDRHRAERKLAWLLCAPAVVAMVIVTGYPIVY